MDTGQIDECLQNVPGYLGTHPRNFLPEVPVSNHSVSLVINTAKLMNIGRPGRIEPGKHWVALIIDPDRTGKYMDSFGNPPQTDEIRMFIARHCRNGCKYNTRIIQNPFSNACGVYCVDFIASGESMTSFLSHFHANLATNDLTTMHRVKDYLTQQRILVDFELK